MPRRISRRSGSTGRRHRSAPASSPAPAIAAASSPHRDTKRHALDIAEHLDARLTLDQPINIHLTGCHHSCAQHHIGDIGLLAAKVAVGEDGEQVEGYHILVGGGFGSDAAIAQPIYSDVKAEDAPAHVERLVRAYLDHRLDAAESFQQFARRLDCEALKRLAVGVAA